MDVFNLLSYINKVSLLAFFITTAVVGYQIYLIRKERSKASKPSIPDFKDMAKSGRPLNYTLLPDVLTKKETQKVNYSGLVFSVISLLTIVVIVFIVYLIRRNSGQSASQTTPANNIQQQNNPKPLAQNNVSPTIIKLSITPSISPAPSPSPTSGIVSVTPTINMSVTPSASQTPSPTEIILANPTDTGTVLQNASDTPVLSKLQSLPVTGSIGKGMVLFGTAITTIILSFWL